MVDFTQHPSINKVDFDGNTYYSISDVEKLFNQKLDGISSINLPLTIDGSRKETECATFDEIYTLLDKTKLSDFNLSLKHSLNWNPKEHKKDNK